MDARLKNALLLYLATFFIIFLVKPGSMFDKRTKKPLEFGLGFNRDRERKTLFALPVTVPLLAIVCFMASGFFTR
jgi:hypothetical protein